MTISILPDGSVQHTLKDSFFRPFIDSHRKVERMSEILFDEEHQAFYVHLLKELVPPENCGYAADREYLNDVIFGGKYFDTYEGAVAYEIETIEELRVGGYIFEIEETESDGHRIYEGAAVPDQSCSGAS